MNTIILKSIFLTTAFCISINATSPYTVFPCSIQYPKAVKQVPQIPPIYQSGESFACEIDQESKRICFTLPVDKSCTTFNLIITDGKISYESNENTILYRKIDTNHPYKFYIMELIKTSKKKYQPNSKNKKIKEKEDHWIISEEKLTGSKIPDDTIIILLNSNYVKELKSNKGFELPTIIIKENILTIAGSEKNLQDEAIKLLLTSIDYNPLHSSFKQNTKQDQQKIIIAMSNI